MSCILISKQEANKIAIYKNSEQCKISNCLKEINKLIIDRCEDGEFHLKYMIGINSYSEENLKEIVKTLRKSGYEVDLDYDDFGYERYLKIYWD